MLSFDGRLRILAFISVLYSVWPSPITAQETGNRERVDQRGTLSPLFLSNVYTFVPAVMGYALFISGVRGTGVGLMLCGFGVGPGTGFLYTERPQWFYVGLSFRTLGLGMVYFGVDALRRDAANFLRPVLGITLVGLAITATSMADDFIWVGHLQRGDADPESRWPRWGVEPVLGWGGPGMGLRLSVVF